MKKTLLPLVLGLILPWALPAQNALLVFDQSGFADAFGDPQPDMAWGVVVDTAGTGFDTFGTSLASFDPFPALSQVDNITLFELPVIGGSGYIFVRAQTNTATLPPFLGGASGYIDELSVPYTTGIEADQSYAVIWFPESRALAFDPYGYSIVSGQLPVGGGTLAVSVSPGSAQYTLIPEPAAVYGLLAILGGVLLLRRRSGPSLP